jgi:hypothetical protein
MNTIPELETNNLEYMQQHGVLFSRWKSDNSRVNEWREVKAIDLVSTIKTLKTQVQYMESLNGINQQTQKKYAELWQEKHTVLGI